MNMTQRNLSTLRQLLLSLAVLFFANHAFAHVALGKSIPAANAMLESSPPELALTFEHPVMLMKLTLIDKMKATAIGFNFKASSSLADAHRFPLPKLENGHYLVNWTAMGKDGHNMSGEFAFMVGSMKDMKMDDMKHHDMKGHDGMSSMSPAKGEHSGHDKK